MLAERVVRERNQAILERYKVPARASVDLMNRVAAAVTN